MTRPAAAGILSTDERTTDSRYSPGETSNSRRKTLHMFDNERNPAAKATCLIGTGMRQDFSWDRSAQQYVTLYEKTLARRG